MECNGVHSVHNPITVSEDMNALRVVCKECWHQYVIRKDPFKGSPEIKEYARIFRRDILQPKDRLFHKIYPQYLRI